jgi:hypothetical protein
MKTKLKNNPDTKQPRYAKLDGRPPSRPRGRHAVARSDVSGEDDATPREIVSLPMNQRLGFRISEFAALVGVSPVSIWRAIKAKEIDVIDVNGIRFIPRAYAIKRGFITINDTV